MHRREFLQLAGSGCAMTALSSSFYDNRGFADELATIDIDSLFEASNPAVLRLTEEVYQKCILGKVFPPAYPMKHRWLAPGGGYHGLWIWDTMFVLDLLSILPDQEQLIRDVFQNYWDFQQRWNAARPDYAHDMVTAAMRVGRQNYVREFTQIPILAWGIERIYQRNGDRQLLQQCLEPTERFHQWYWRERDVTNIGMIAVGAYSGKTQHARYETFDYECNLDDLKLTSHPTRKGKGEGAWYGNILAAGNTAYLIMAERSLVRLAEIIGDHEMAARRKARIDKAVEAMRTHMWDEQAGTFLSINRDTLEKIPIATIGSWMPLVAGVPTKAMAQRMAETLRTPSWQTPLPVPTVDRKDKRWRSKGFWRGDVWPPTNYQIASGLAVYGYTDLAAEIADKTVANAMKNGISEHYDSISGKPLGVKFLGMSCTIITMMLDGLTRNYQLKIRETA